MSVVLPDPTTAFGKEVQRRLRDEPLIWLTTVDAGGMPQPNPVWFWWDGESILVYNLPRARRLAHIQQRPQVTLHFDSDGSDGGIVVISGEARICPDEAPADQVPGFLAKYRGRMVRMTPEQWGRHFAVALRVQPAQVRGHAAAAPPQPD